MVSYILPIYARKNLVIKRSIYIPAHHVHSMASSQYAHYRVHADTSMTAQQKVHHPPKTLNKIPKSHSSTRNNNTSIRSYNEGFSRFISENTIIIILSRSQQQKWPLYEVGHY